MVSQFISLFVIGRLVGPFSEKTVNGILGSIFKPEVTAFYFTDFLLQLIGLQVGFLPPLCPAFNRLTRRLQNIFISNYFRLVAFSSPDQFSKSCFFPVKIFVQNLKYFVLRTKTITVSRCESLDLRLLLPQIEYQIARKFVKCIPQKFSQTKQ